MKGSIVTDIPIDDSTLMMVASSPLYEYDSNTYNSSTSDSDDIEINNRNNEYFNENEKKLEKSIIVDQLNDNNSLIHDEKSVSALKYENSFHTKEDTPTLRRRNKTPTMIPKSPIVRSKSMPGISKTLDEKKKEQKKRDVTFFQYLLQEFNMDLGANIKNGWNDEALEALYRSPSSIRSGVYNFLSVPFCLEKFIAYAILICMDIFLYYIVLVPIRIIFTFIKIILRRPLKISDICDLLRVFTISIAVFVLMPKFNYSFLYHYIRGQSTLKLYVTYNMLELFDKMASAFGIDIQDAMFYSTTKLYFDREISKSERWSVFKDAILSIIGYTVYLFIHTTILYMCIITLNVALNSSNNALLSLLLSNNFLELKKPIFKRFAKENVFQFSCHDATERFQLLIFGLVISMQNSRAAVFSGTEFVDIMYCILAEIIVDFLKHGFISKFNNVSSSVYGKFLDKLCEDMTEDRLQDTFLDNMNIACRRLGFTPIPLVTITLYVTYLFLQPSIHDSWYRLFFFFQIYITLLLIKFLTNICVIGIASWRRIAIERKRQKIALIDSLTQKEKDIKETSQEDPPEKDNGELNLSKIFRYALFGKRLPD